ncbi:hypothetical protein FRC12_023685 [Ceratobasidium sp. 428]|nr:hypothetical protein FRC12_023685 [Ceratobasidium sp. 428]
MPYLVLWLATATSGCGIATLIMLSVQVKDLANKQKITLGVWVFGSFFIDLLMTCTSTSNAHNDVFTTIWNVIWAAAAPPLAVMLVVMVDGYMVPGSDHGWATFFTNLSGKVYALSIMITLAGRGYVRQKLSDVNIGRACSSSTTREINSSGQVFQHHTGRERANQGTVLIQLSHLARTKTPTNNTTNQNDSDYEPEEPQRSKASIVEHCLSNEV